MLLPSLRHQGGTTLKQGVNPAIAAVVIILVVAVVGFFIWKGVGPRTDGPSQPIDMGKLMSKDKLAPPVQQRPGMGGGTPR